MKSKEMNTNTFAQIILVLLDKKSEDLLFDPIQSFNNFI